MELKPSVKLLLIQLMGKRCSLRTSFHAQSCLGLSKKMRTNVPTWCLITITTSFYLLPHCLVLISHCKMSKMSLWMELKPSQAQVWMSRSKILPLQMSNQHFNQSQWRIMIIAFQPSQKQFWMSRSNILPLQMSNQQFNQSQWRIMIIAFHPSQ